MKKRMLMILCGVFIICSGVVSSGCSSDINDYLKYELLLDGTYSVGLKEDYLESFTIDIDEDYYVPSIERQRNKIGRNYSKIPRNIEIPSSYKGKPVTKIADGGFSNNNIENITLPNSITCIGAGAFCGTNLTTITIPDWVEIIEEYAFIENNFNTLTIPNSVKRIGEYAFAKNSNLSNVNLGDGISCIDVGTFCGCEQLTAIVIPKNIRTIEDYAFSYTYEQLGEFSTELETLYYKGDAKEWAQMRVPEVLSSNIETLYYTADGDIAKFIDESQSVQRAWTYNDEQKLEIIDIIYDDAIDGKTFFFSYGDINISNDGWNMLLIYDKNNRLKELLSNDQIEIFKKSNSKEEYVTAIKSYYLEEYSNMSIILKNETLRIWRDGKPDLHSYSYKLANGKIYIQIGSDYCCSYILSNDTLLAAYNYEYGKEELYFKER